jgi:hypothetical protein
MNDRTYCILAIDPGLTGAIAFYYMSQKDRVAVYDMPVVENGVNPAELSALIGRHTPAIAVIERVGPMPRDGVAQAWRFSAAYATARVVVALNNIPQVLITPASWKKAMGLPGGKDNKDRSRGMAMRLFPACAISFGRKKDASRAEAALLAYHYAQTKGLLVVPVL